MRCGSTSKESKIEDGELDNDVAAEANRISNPNYKGLIKVQNLNKVYKMYGKGCG